MKAHNRKVTQLSYFPFKKFVGCNSQFYVYICIVCNSHVVMCNSQYNVYTQFCDSEMCNFLIKITLIEIL